MKQEKLRTHSKSSLYITALGIPKLLELISDKGCVCRHLEYDQHPEAHIYLIIQRSNQTDRDNPINRPENSKKQLNDKTQQRDARPPFSRK